jgi:hypothetical protein
MAERHELTLKLLVTAEEEETVTEMLNHCGFEFKKIGELQFCDVENTNLTRIRYMERGCLSICTWRLWPSICV